MSIKVGKIIKSAIKRRKMTQKQVAKKIHISPQALSNYVTDKRMPDLECFFNLVDLLELEEYFMFPRLSDRTFMSKYISRNVKTLTFEQVQLLYLILKLIKDDE